MQIPFANKFRLDRGPLRDWLVIAGLLTVVYDPARYVGGWCLLGLGTVLHFVSKCCLRQNKALTLSGPYRFVRNPFYLANLIAEIGLLLIIGNPWVAAIYLVLWFYIYGKTIRSEESHLSQLFSEQFAAYCRAVPRLFPIPGKVLPREQVTGPQFSLRNRNIIEGREIQRTLRLLSFPLLFLAAAEVRVAGIHWPSDWTARFVIGILGFALLNAVGAAVSMRLSKRADLLKTGGAGA